MEWFGESFELFLKGFEWFGESVGWVGEGFAWGGDGFWVGVGFDGRCLSGWGLCFLSFLRGSFFPKPALFNRSFPTGFVSFRVISRLPFFAVKTGTVNGHEIARKRNTKDLSKFGYRVIEIYESSEPTSQRLPDLGAAGWGGGLFRVAKNATISSRFVTDLLAGFGIDCLRYEDTYQFSRDYFYIVNAGRRGLCPDGEDECVSDSEVRVDRSG